MKLIIDIPDIVFNQIKQGEHKVGEWLNCIEHSIKSGIPCDEVETRRITMTNEEAKDFLSHYICSCQYGTSPMDCDDPKCKFGLAIRTLCDEAEVRFITEEDYVYNKKKRRWELKVNE